MAWRGPPPTDQPKIKDARATLGRLGGYLTPERRLVTIAGVAVLAASVLSMVPPWVTKTVVDDIIPQPTGSGNKLLLIGVFLVALQLATAGLTYANRYVIVLVGQKVVYDIGRDLFGHIERLPLRFYERQESGQIMSRVTNDVGALQQTLVGPTVSAIVGCFNIVIYLVILFALNWRLTLLILSTAPALVVASAVSSQILRIRYRRVQEKIADVNAMLQENVAGARVSKAFARESVDMERFQGQNRQNMQANLDAVTAQSISNPVRQMLTTVGTCLVLWYGASLVMLHSLTIGELIAFTSYLTALYGPINDLINVSNTVQQALAAADRVFQFLDEPTEVEDPDALAPARVEGRLTFDHVSFGYDPDKPVLHDICLDVEPGEMLALVGHTGSGKTTMANLVARFYDPTAGAVLLDGHDLRSLRLSWLRSQMAIVLQETFLFGATVRANIAYGVPDASEEQVIRSAQLANAHDFVERLPDGYDTEVAEGGAKLSRGQRQRIALARAILKNPAILILDEATSDVDTETEILIQRALEGVVQGRTVFVIAHRLSTIQKASRIVVLDAGRIVEVGSHRELLALGGVYRELYELQFAQPTAVGSGQAGG